MFEDEARYWETMDSVVATAEEFGIGLIPSFFWQLYGVSDYFDEPRGAWTDPTSKTRGYMKDYTVHVVSRYKESPALWMWEFSNEFNLELDLPNRKSLREAANPPVHLGCRPTRTEEDDLMTDFAGDVPAEFARLCKAYDVHDRLITCGNAEPRRSQYQQRVLDQWPPRPDTYAEMAKALEWHNPDPLNCISVHCYDLEKRFPGTETYTGLLRAYRTAADRLGKPLFLGEFHGLKKENALETIRAINLGK
jgi:hypothetical protein